MTAYSDIDLVYLWLDFSDHWLKTATTEMIMSAQRAMPGINIIQISDKAARKHPLANSAMVFDKIVDRADLAAFKGYAFAEHALRTERPTIFCDVDVIWSSVAAAEALRFYHLPTIWLSSRDSDEFAIMPYDTAVMMYRPGDADTRYFWREYQRMCDSCKPGFREWWGDQLALGALMGHEYPVLSRIGEFRDIPDRWAKHFGGDRDGLVPYARLIDGGAPFEALMPGLADVVHDHA